MAARWRDQAVRAAPLLAAGAAGAGLAFLLDRGQGRRRRHELRDRTLAIGRRGMRRTERRANYAAGVVLGTARRAAATARHQPGDYDDTTLARKVETEIFRPADAPKASVSVNVQHGVVQLRGQVEHPEDIRRLGDAAARVDGVDRVDNLLHTPGSPPKHAPPSTPDEVRQRAAEPRAASRFSRNPATTPPADEPLADRAPPSGPGGDQR